MKYYIRKSWEDTDSQIGDCFSDLQEAIKECKYPYIIFNENGEPVVMTSSINLNDGNITISRKDYRSMWNKLKKEYSDRSKIVEQGSGLALESLRMFYKDILNKMEELEKSEEEILWEGN